MFNLTTAYVNQDERERDIERGLRRRQILNSPDAIVSPIEPADPRTARMSGTIPSQRPTQIHAGAAGR